MTKKNIVMSNEQYKQMKNAKKSKRRGKKKKRK